MLPYLLDGGTLVDPYTVSVVNRSHIAEGC